MKNFDEAHEVRLGDESVRMASREEILGFDREFTLGGETFKRRAVLHPRVMARFWDLDGAIDSKLLDEIYGIARACVDPADLERFSARLDNEDDPISYITLRELIAWFISEDTNRPLGLVRDSSDGSETKEATTSSTVGSSSPAAHSEQPASLSAVS